MKNNKHINKEIITFDTIEAYQKKRFEGLYASSKIVNLRKYVSIDKIIEFGCLVGISGKFFNPKMSSFLVSNYRGRNPQFDVAKTIAFLDRAYKAINNSAKEGKKILIVGTVGDIVKKHIKEEAERVGCFYINQRWLGGTLTNFKIVSKTINKLKKTEELLASDEINKYTKKEQVMFQKEVEKLNKFVGGIKNMDSLPNLIIVINPVNEKNAIAEAIKLNIPVVAISNSNASPEKINFLIPGNSSSQKSLVLLVSILCDAIAEANGKETRVVGKADADIILPEVAKKVQEESIVSHNKSSYGYRNYDNRNQGYDNKNQNFNSKK